MTRNSRGLASQLVQQATILNDYSPTFTRASTAYDPYNKTIVASGARRRRPFPIVPSITVYGDLIESSRTNLCVRSNDFANWGTLTDVTITSAAITPQDGTGTADLITEGTAGTAKVLSAAMTITAGRVVTAQARFKAGATGSWVQVTVASDTLANGWRTWANISTGAVGSQSAIGTGSAIGTPVLTSLGNGEYLLTSIGKAAAAATSIQIQISSASADASTTRVNSAAYYCWAIDVEMMAASATTGNPSTYIATTTTSVTRAADAMSTPYVLGQTGTILAVCVPYLWTGDQDGVSNYALFQCDDTNNSRSQRANATAVTSVRADAGGVEFTNILHGFTSGSMAELALTWDSTAVRGYANGVASTPDTSLTSPYNTNTIVRIGGTSSAGQYFGGHIAILAWPRALAASEVLAIFSAMPAAA